MMLLIKNELLVALNCLISKVGTDVINLYYKLLPFI